MRALRDPDAFPTADLGLLRALGVDATTLASRAEAWRPWRAYAAMYLWKKYSQSAKTQATKSTSGKTGKTGKAGKTVKKNLQKKNPAPNLSKGV